MTDTEIETYRNRLSDLTAQCSDTTKEKEILTQLQKLAREVGASTCTSYIAFSSSSIRIATATTSELIGNIHQALQTASMINMCGTATQGYEMATEASNRASQQFRIAAGISVLSAIAAVVSAVATCVMAVLTFKLLS